MTCAINNVGTKDNDMAPCRPTTPIEILAKIVRLTNQSGLLKLQRVSQTSWDLVTPLIYRSIVLDNDKIWTGLFGDVMDGGFEVDGSRKERREKAFGCVHDLTITAHPPREDYW